MHFDRRAMAQLAAEIPVILLAGGLGTRLSEETINIPKPMVKIGGLPIIVHIMDYYAKFGFKRFVICGGYRIEVLKDYLLTLPYAGKDIEISFSKENSQVKVQPSRFSNPERNEWNVTVLETGLHSMTGYRLGRAIQSLKAKGFRRFCLTYGDGLTDADLHAELAFHLEHKAVATVLGVHQPTRFGILQYEADGKVKVFAEKPLLAQEFINGGYFVLNQEIETFIDTEDTDCIFEQKPLVKLAQAGQLYVHRHEGFWQCMDTMREKLLLENLYNSGDAPWLNKVI